MKMAVVACLPILVLTACSGSSTPDGGTTSPVADATPTHNYKVKEGSNYGYLGGLSDEDKSKGKAAADLVLFRYLGEKDGLYKVQQIEENGQAILSISCTKPCEFMKLSVGGEVSRVEYNPATLGGAVIQDALSGELEVADSKKK